MSAVHRDLQIFRNISLEPATAFTIASGVITAGSRYSYLKVASEGAAASDDLDTITFTGVADGDIVVVTPSSASQTIVVKHGTGNIAGMGAADVSLAELADECWLKYNSRAAKYVVFAVSTLTSPPAGASYMPLAGGSFSGAVLVNDNVALGFGTTTADLTITSNGTNTTFDNVHTTGATFFDLGTDSSATKFAIRNNSGTEILTVKGDSAITYPGNGTINFGTGALTIGGTALATTAAYQWTIKDADAASLAIGSSGDLSMLLFDTTEANEVIVVGAALGLRANDNIPVRFGTPGTDLVLTPDGTDVVATATGDLVFADSVDVYYGTGKDTGFKHNGTNTIVDHNTGELIFAMGVRALTQDPEIGGEIKRLCVDTGAVDLDTGDGTTTLTLSIPAGARIVAACANVTTAIAGVSASGVTIAIALITGSTLTLGTLVSAGDGNLAANTKFTTFIDPNTAGLITSATTNAEVTISGGGDNAPTSGAVRLLVWYESVAALDSV